MPIKPKELVSKLNKLGFEIIRSSGSHLILRHPDGRQTYVSVHTKDLPEGTYKAILKQAQLSKFDIENI
ncbi:MAG TPA: type II toxin-antitoxin system HicA family toxin [Candidatus Kapabacteria bacterium]|nr:type II toxin-antitoxin system HicA family toxin [Candidatus Kapabacteria bacterium]